MKQPQIQINIGSCHRWNVILFTDISQHDPTIIIIIHLTFSVIFWQLLPLEDLLMQPYLDHQNLTNKTILQDIEFVCIRVKFTQAPVLMHTTQIWCHQVNYTLPKAAWTSYSQFWWVCCGSNKTILKANSTLRMRWRLPSLWNTAHRLQMEGGGVTLWRKDTGWR